MDGEISNFIEVWLSIFLSLCCCYTIGKLIPKGKTRFFLVLPIVCLFLYLPLNLSSIHLGGTTAFFVAWLANFKLLLFAFGKGPLSSHASISLASFVAAACLPIKIHESPPPESQNKENPSPKIPKETQKSPLNYAIKAVLLTMLIRVYDYNEHIHPKIILCLYCLHIYFFLEIVLTLIAALAQTILGLELEQQFNEPHLSTSLQDFWGKRWNLMVSSILRQTVYEPTLNFSKRAIGRKWATIPAVLGTFFVSAIMHELIFYYLRRTKPTWEVTCFFILHGFCLTVEIALKKVLKGRWQFPRLISWLFTIGFVMVTGFWLFFPDLLLRCRADVRAFEEYKALGASMKNFSRTLFKHSIVSSL